MNDKKLNNLQSLCHEISKTNAIKYLINNEQDKNKQQKIYEVVCDSNILLGCSILSSFFEEDGGLKEIINTAATEKYNKALIKQHVNGSRRHSRHSLNRLYFSLLYLNKIDEANTIVKILIEASKSTNKQKKHNFIFLNNVLAPFFNGKIANEHCLILINYNLKNDLHAFDFYFRKQFSQLIDKEKISKALINSMRKDNCIKIEYLTIIRKYELFEFFDNFLNDYLSGKLFDLEKNTFKRVLFITYCYKNGYKEKAIKRVYFRKDEIDENFIMYINSLKTEMNQRFIDLNYNNLLSIKKNKRNVIMVCQN